MIYTLIIIILLLGLAALAYMRFEASFVELKRIRFSKKNNCLKVLHLSDIHIPFLRVPVKRVKKLISMENPDIILLTGDYIIKPAQADAFFNFLDEIANGSKMYLCFGNHDHKAFIRNPKEIVSFENEIQKRGITILSNNSEVFIKGTRKFNIIGIDDIKYNHHDIGKALASRSKECSIDIAIAHNPDTVLEMPANAVDYLFCGHFHGGQIWVPFNIEFMLLRKDKLPKKGIRRGFHKINGINVYINRGLGNVSVPLRFFSRPEITVYYI
ncbi:MAG TPA: metallophosphoesterase [Clostridia bacterium]|nr:metallophosphoesterase [Clostridia bacterium]